MLDKFIKYFDGHYIINFFGITIRLKSNRAYHFDEPKEVGVINSDRETKIIVSLTSHPKRIKSVIKTIKTLLTQSLKPDKVILWLAVEQFTNKENNLPIELLNLKEYGLSIEWCEDIRSYKKIVPTLIKYPDSIIITVDDDIYYAKDTVEVLYHSYLNNPKCIHANRCDWLKVVTKEDVICERTKELFLDKHRAQCSYRNRLTGYGAVLYPPNSLHCDVIKKEIFMNIIPTHDDIWLWAMAVLNSTKTVLVKGYSESINYVEDSQEVGLCKINKKGKGMSIKKAYDEVFKIYPQIVEIVNGEK